MTRLEKAINAELKRLKKKYPHRDISVCFEEDMIIASSYDEAHDMAYFHGVYKDVKAFIRKVAKTQP